jgi:AraC-like DNA-binding protein
MSAWPQQRSISSAQLLTQLAQEFGISLADCLRGTGITVHQLNDNLAEVSAEQELALVTNIIQANNGRTPALGLMAGKRYHLGSYGIWGFALLSSATLREAIQLGIRYIDLTFSFNQAQLAESPTTASLILDGSAIPEHCRQFLVERDLAAIMTMVEELFNLPAPLQQVTFTHAAPVDISPYQRIFGLTPLFSQPCNALCFDHAFLDFAIPQGNIVIAQLCEQQCKDLLTRRQQRSGIAAKVRDILLTQPQHLPSMDIIAERLCMSSRTLRRHLLAEGVSYRLLIDEVRMTLAEELLTLRGMTLEQISLRLGYSEVSNFLHAFKRCQGITPSEFRQRALTNGVTTELS